MHIVQRRYKVDRSNMPRIQNELQTGFLPIIKTAHGFVSYQAFEAENGDLCTISLFQDRAGAEHSIELARDYVKEHLASMLPSAPMISQGETLVSS